MAIDYTEKVRVENDLEELRKLALVHAAENGFLRKRLNDVVRQLAEAKGLTVQELFGQEASVSGSATPNNKYGKGSRRSSNNPRTDNKPKEKPTLGATPQRTQEVLDLDDADKTCPECGAELEHRESLDDQSKVITIEHSIVIEIDVIRKGYACACCEHIENALPHDEQFLSGGRYGITLVVQLIVFKYWQSMPLNRQVKFFADHGLDLATQTMWDNVWQATKMLEPVYDEILAEAQAADVAHADETRWNVRNGNGKAWVWTLSTATAVAFIIRSGRDNSYAKELLGNFGGILVTDGMSAYTTLINDRWDAHHNPELWSSGKPPPLIIRAGCWAHTRTYWAEAAEHFPLTANPIIHSIGNLYRIVEGAEEHRLSDQLRRKWVDAALAHIKKSARALDVLPGTRLDAAKKYTLNQWERLIVFAEHRQVPLDNNFAERSLRTPVLGRKNFQGTKSERGSKAAEVFYTIIATCLRLGVSPRSYIDAALRVARDSGNKKMLTPRQFKAQTAS